MATCNKESASLSLELPAEFEGLEGFLETDLRAIVSVLTQRANERLLLTKRETRDLRANLWERLSQAINQSVEPLSAERR